MATIAHNETPIEKNSHESQPDQLDQGYVTPRNKEETLKSSVVISTVEAKDLTKEVVNSKPEDVRKGLVGLHSRIDSILSRSGIIEQTSPVLVQSPLRTSVLSAHPETYISETYVSTLPPLHGEIRDMTSRIVSTLAQSRSAYTTIETPLKSNPYVTSAGYEVKTLASVEQALHNKSNYSYQYTSSPLLHNQSSFFYHTSSPTYLAGTYDLRQEKHNTYISHVEPVRSAVPRAAPGVSSNFYESDYDRHYQTRNIQARDHYYTGDITNDKDSLVLDYLDNQSEYSEPEQAFVEEDEDPRVKVIGRPNEEAEFKRKNNKDNGELVLKGPYSQRKRDRITSQQAKKFFERTNEIEDFDFVRTKAR